MQNRFQYLLSYCVMTEGANPMGHGSLFLSVIDNEKGDNARAEILEAVGFYSRYMPVLGYKPISQGRVKQEDFNFIAEVGGLSHMTWKITEEEFLKTFAKINADRRNVGNERPRGKSQNGELQEDKPGGPIFNILKGHNCKRYALERIEDLGINVQNIHSPLEIPKISGKLNPLKVVRVQEEGVERFYWDCPLMVTSRPKAAQQFMALKEGVDQILQLLQTRQTELHGLGREVSEISRAIEEMDVIKAQMLQMQNFPKRITRENIHNVHEQIRGVVTECTDSLKYKGIEYNLIARILDSFKEMCSKIYQAVCDQPTELQEYKPNMKDAAVIKEVEEIDHQFSRLSMN